MTSAFVGGGGGGWFGAEGFFLPISFTECSHPLLLWPVCGHVGMMRVPDVGCQGQGESTCRVTGMTACILNWKVSGGGGDRLSRWQGTKAPGLPLGEVPVAEI